VFALQRIVTTLGLRQRQRESQIRPSSCLLERQAASQLSVSQRRADLNRSLSRLSPGSSLCPCFPQSHPCTPIDMLPQVATAAAYPRTASSCGQMNSRLLSQSVRVRVRVTLQLTVSQSVRLGVEPDLGLLNRDNFFFFWKVTVLSFGGALSDERSGLSFVSLQSVYSSHSGL
jgi:hypothetical protein